MKHEAGDGTKSASVWRVVHASVRGTSHIATDAPCQDAAEVVVETEGLPDGPIAFLACADGAGSAPLSHEGAQQACSSIIGEARDYLRRAALASVTREVVEGWYAQVHAAVADRARELDRPVRDLACTLLFAVLGETRTVCAQIGDGAIVIDDGDGAYRAATWPQSGEYANTTHFATEPEALRHLQVECIEGRRVEDVALFSDGLEKLALYFQDKSVHAPFFAPFFQRLRALSGDEAVALAPQLVAFLDSPAVNARTDDDKTLVLATRRSGVAMLA